MMNRPALVGITGGIGSGKSIISAVFVLLGVPVYNADERARFLMTADPTLVEDIKKAFGPKAYLEGQLNRPYLAEKVFASQEATAQLNSFVHPAVGKDFAQWASEQQGPYVLKEAALLFETGSYQELDKVILVTAPRDLRISRVQKRDPQRSMEQINNIIGKQMNEAEAIQLADHVLLNDGSQLLIPQILDLDKQIKRAIC